MAYPHEKNLNIFFPILSAVRQYFSALSSEHHRVATVTHKLQKVHFPSKENNLNH